jgi:hypothetical protein
MGVLVAENRGDPLGYKDARDGKKRASLAQMQRRMTIGSAVKGVLCADGHLGYAHPIGGVVA